MSNRVFFHRRRGRSRPAHGKGARCDATGQGLGKPSSIGTPSSSRLRRSIVAGCERGDWLLKFKRRLAWVLSIGDPWIQHWSDDARDFGETPKSTGQRPVPPTDTEAAALTLGGT